MMYYILDNDKVVLTGETKEEIEGMLEFNPQYKGLTIYKLGDNPENVFEKNLLSSLQFEKYYLLRRTNSDYITSKATQSDQLNLLEDLQLNALLGTNDDEKKKQLQEFVEHRTKALNAYNQVKADIFSFDKYSSLEEYDVIDSYNSLVGEEYGKKKKK